MSEQSTDNEYISLPIDAVISVVNQRDLLVQTGITFQLDEFLTQVSQKCSPPNVLNREEQEDVRHNWCFEGIDAKVLIPGQTWQKGKVRLTMEFYPDQPTSETEVEVDESKIEDNKESEIIDFNDIAGQPENPISPLDDIRQTLLKNDSPN